MKTTFYKILYKNKDVVYVGVTLRTVNQRFKEHIISKHLDPKYYSVVEFFSLEHPDINSITIFYKELLKVSNLEKKYIQEEKDNGAHLMNISTGGEWGAHILNKIKKENFFSKYGSYDGYNEFKRKVDKTKTWLRNFICNRSRNKTKVWLRHFICCRSQNKTKTWLRNFICCRSQNKTKTWLRNFICCRSQNKTKTWLRSFVYCRSQNKTKTWLRNFIRCRSRQQT